MTLICSTPQYPLYEERSYEISRPDVAAEEHASRVFDDSGADVDLYPLTVAVRADDDIVTLWVVDLDWEPTMYATPLEV